MSTLSNKVLCGLTNFAQAAEPLAREVDELEAIANGLAGAVWLSAARVCDERAAMYLRDREGAVPDTEHAKRLAVLIVENEGLAETFRKMVGEPAPTYARASAIAECIAIVKAEEREAYASGPTVHGNWLQRARFKLERLLKGEP